jgi:hypothetical protein
MLKKENTMKDVIKSENYKNYRIDIVNDENADNPRVAWDNASHILCYHRQYELGDDQMSHEEFMDLFNSIKKRKDVVWRYLYLYDHSMISISMESFIGRAHHAEWDSGRVGFVYMTHEDIRKNWNIKKVTQAYRDKAIELMGGEVKTYDDYVRGNIYGYIVTKIEKDADGDETDGEEIDSCYGFYGDYDKDLMTEAKRTCDFDEKKRLPLLKDQLEVITS